MPPTQLLLDLRPDMGRCPHRSAFVSMAFVPAGEVCTVCGQLLMQYVVPEDQPKTLGYVSADWAWHYRDGKAWTTMDEAERSADFSDDAD